MYLYVKIRFHMKYLHNPKYVQYSHRRYSVNCVYIYYDHNTYSIINLYLIKYDLHEYFNLGLGIDERKVGNVESIGLSHTYDNK